jgi:phosphosulfolactate phosphohydrolase-like enzyme
MRPTFFVIPLLLWLGSCGSPPRPPGVDESAKRPANARTAVELQACKGNLQNAHIEASESSRIAKAAFANLQRLSARQQVIDAIQAANTTRAAGNSIFTIRFDFASTRVVVPTDIARALIESARGAPQVLLRGRTRGQTVPGQDEGKHRGCSVGCGPEVEPGP